MNYRTQRGAKWRDCLRLGANLEEHGKTSLPEGPKAAQESYATLEEKKCKKCVSVADEAKLMGRYIECPVGASSEGVRGSICLLDIKVKFLEVKLFFLLKVIRVGRIVYYAE